MLSGMSTQNRLREFRKARKLNQTALSTSAGVSQGSVSKIENGRIPEIDTAQKLARALGLRVDTVFPAFSVSVSVKP